MWFFLLALALGALKTLSHLQVLDWPWVATMSWWWVAGAFALTAAWWAWADYSGWTARRAAARTQARQAARVARHKQQLGLQRRR